jgi:peroxiredoxin Q/BCP
MLKIGDKIPSLTGATATDVVIRLHDLRGKFVVVFFYPKDNTTGCTREAQDFANLHAEFVDRNAVVLGVSRDSIKSHANFTAKFSLPFTLISDGHELWCRTFDVIHEKQLYGRHYLGIVRSTFLIDPRGKLNYEWRNVKVSGHAEAVLDMLDSQRT